jgi:flagellin-like protein
MLIKKINNKKKAVSPVIATILLVLISISAVAIVANFVIQFINNSLEKGECYNLIGAVKIDDSQGYYCHYQDEEISKEKIKITIERDIKSKEINGIIISISATTDSESFEIKQGSADTGVSMYNGEDIVLPNKGERKTYEITTNLPSDETLSAVIAPIAINGKTCDQSKRITLQEC